MGGRDRAALSDFRDIDGETGRAHARWAAPMPDVFAVARY
jgi:hypothetical protein